MSEKCHCLHGGAAWWEAYSCPGFMASICRACAAESLPFLSGQERQQIGQSSLQAIGIRNLIGPKESSAHTHR